MLSLSPAMSAGQAGGYFSREDYYLRDAELGENSRWLGRGAQELGLEGAVGQEDFQALCRGEDPAGNRIVAPNLSRDKESGQLIETRRAGNDCTFSAPKPVSVLYAAGVDGAKQAHDAAVLSVMRHIEERYSLYSSPEGMKNGGLVAAKFDHATSRNIDPQLHSHVFLVNAVLTPEGDWRANDPKVIFQDKKSLGFLYRVELVRELEARGFQVELTDRSQMFFDIKGVDPRLVEYFSSRRVEIEAQVDLWKEEGRFTGVPHGRLYEMAALETRDPKREITREEVERYFERGFEGCGTSLEEVRREVDLSRMPMGEERQRLPEEPAAAVVELAARELTGREAVLERGRLLEEAARISGTRHGLPELNAAIDEADSGVVRLGQNSRGREYYTTRDMLKLEAGNLERVRDLAGIPFPVLASREELDGFRERLALEGVRPTAGQWKEFEGEAGGGGSFQLTVGDPGTAKTRTLGLVERLNEEVLVPQGRGFSSINLACTGKAARELGNATGRPASTLDSFLNDYATSKFDPGREKTEGAILGYWGEKNLISEGLPVVIRLDEASFLGAKQAGELLGVVRELQDKGIPVKLHLLGDTKQMQAVAAGDFLRQVQELGAKGEVDFAHLTEILRQRDPGLLEIARGLNREDRPPGENAWEALADLAGRRALTVIPSEPDLTRAAVEHYLEESRKPSLIPERALAGERQSVLMMTGTNAERRELNQEVRQARVAAGEIEEGKTFAVLAPVSQGITVECYRPGDTVLFPGVRGEDGKLRSWGARIGTEAEVVGLDRRRNLVQVRYSFEIRKKDQVRERTVTRQFSAAEMEGKTALFRGEERNLAVGDRIVALKNDKKLDLENGDIGVIRELDGRGRAVLDLGTRQVELDLTRYRQVDHAYAVTVYKGQGTTVEHSIMVALVRPEIKQGIGREISPEHEPYGQVSYNALNVAITRAQFGAHVFTNSAEGLAKSVEHADNNSSTLTGPPKGERGAARDLGKDHALQASHLDLGEQIRRMGQAIPRPGEKVRRLDVESIRVPSLPAAERDRFKPIREIPVVQKQIGRDLELPLPRKGFGKGFER